MVSLIVILHHISCIDSKHRRPEIYTPVESTDTVLMWHFVHTEQSRGLKRHSLCHAVSMANAFRMSWWKDGDWVYDPSVNKEYLHTPYILLCSYSLAWSGWSAGRGCPRGGGFSVRVRADCDL